LNILWKYNSTWHIPAKQINVGNAEGTTNYGQSRELGNKTQDVGKQSKNTTQYVLDTTICKQTNNVIKTWVLLQTTEGNDEPNIVFMHFKHTIIQDLIRIIL
jgi:hypothetical protein